MLSRLCDIWMRVNALPIFLTQQEAPMRIINYICDKCGMLAGTNKLNAREKEPFTLLPVAYEEWCVICIGKFTSNA